MRYTDLRDTTIKVVILSLATILFIPCVSKRELKQFFNIPVSERSHFTNTQFTQTCEHDVTVTEQKHEQRNNVAKHIVPQTSSNGFVHTSYYHATRSYTLIGPTTLLPPYSRCILHQQFLI